MMLSISDKKIAKQYDAYLSVAYGSEFITCSITNISSLMLFPELSLFALITSKVIFMQYKASSGSNIILGSRQILVNANLPE